MKNYPKIITFVPLFIFLISASCKKEKLTKETQIGANTFSCKINGVIHIPNDEAFSVRAIHTSLTLNEDPSYFNLSITTNYSREKPSEQVYITLYKLKEIGIYKLDSTKFRYGTYLLDVLNNYTGFFGVTYNSRTFNKG